jgi:hypothetical protein
MHTSGRSVQWAVVLGLVFPATSSAQAAFRTSVVGTAVPVALGTILAATADFKGDQAIAGYGIASLGLSAGPSLGHWQLGERRRGWVGAGGRLLLTWGSVALASATLKDCDLWTCPDDQVETAAAIMLAGHVAAGFWALRDIAALRGESSWQPTRSTGRPRVSVAPSFAPRRRASRLVVSVSF